MKNIKYPILGLTPNGGSLKAIGNNTDNIIFTSKNDNTVGNTITNNIVSTASTGTPGKGDWNGIYFSSTSTASNIEYAQIKYTTNAVYLSYSNNITVKNSLLTQNSLDGLSISSGCASCIIQNNIFYNNTGLGLSVTSSTPIMSYNLFYLNTGGNSNVTINTPALGNVINIDPLFVNATVGDYSLQATSSGVNAGNPGFGNHIYSGDRYDIGPKEYMGFLNKIYGASIGNVLDRTLTYEWSFINGPEIPVINSSTGSINSDSIISSSFILKKLGNYQIKLEVFSGSTLVGEGINNFSVTN